jgi:malonyl-CoA O-methyltransferase
MVPSDRKHRIGRAFAAAEDYDRWADVQRIVAGRLARRIAATPLPAGPRILEIGCGTGFLALALGEQIADARWVISDLAPAMVARSRRGLGVAPDRAYLVMDGERPCFDGPRFDLICSSLAVQWFSEPAASIARLFALLRPGGLLAFATMGEESFVEWRAAHGPIAPGTPAYPPAATLAPAGASLVIEEERLPRHFADARAFLRHLKAIGAGVPAAGRSPLAAGEMRTVMRRFEEGGAVATYHVAYCLFRKAHDRENARR